MSDVKYPEIEVELTGVDGNALSIVAVVAKALRRGGVAPEEVKVFQREALSGDYNNVLSTAMRWVDVS